MMYFADEWLRNGNITFVHEHAWGILIHSFVLCFLPFWLWSTLTTNETGVRRNSDVHTSKIIIAWKITTTTDSFWKNEEESIIIVVLFSGNKNPPINNHPKILLLVEYYLDLSFNHRRTRGFGFYVLVFRTFWREEWIFVCSPFENSVNFAEHIRRLTLVNFEWRLTTHSLIPKWRLWNGNGNVSGVLCCAVLCLQMPPAARCFCSPRPSVSPLPSPWR